MVGEIYFSLSEVDHKQHPTQAGKIYDYFKKCNLSDDIIDSSFSLFVEPVIAFTIDVAKDTKVLSQLIMHHTTASHKLKYGVAELFCDKLIQKSAWYTILIKP